MRSLRQIIHDRYEYTVHIDYSFRYRTSDASDECKHTPWYRTQVQMNNCCQNRKYELKKKSRCPKAQPEVKELLYYFFSEEYHTILQCQSFKTADGESSLFSSVELPPIGLIESVSIRSFARRNNKSYQVREVHKDSSSPKVLHTQKLNYVSLGSASMDAKEARSDEIYNVTRRITLGDKFLSNLSKLNSILGFESYYDIDISKFKSSAFDYACDMVAHWKDLVQRDCTQGKKARLLIDLLSNELKEMKSNNLDSQCWDEKLVNENKLEIFKIVKEYTSQVMRRYDMMVNDLFRINRPEINPQLPLYEHLGELCNIVRPYISEVEVGIIKPLRGHSIGEIEMGKLYDELQSSKEIISKTMKRGEFIYWMTGKKQEGIIPDQKHLPMQVSMDYRIFVLLFDAISLNKWTILSQLFKLDEGILDPDDMKRSASDMRRSLRKSDSARVNQERLTFVSQTFYRKMFDPFSNIHKYLKDDYRNYF